MTGQEFKQKLHNGNLLLGTRITSASLPWSRLARDLNLDFVFIDNEHYPLSPHETALLCHTHFSVGVVPMVRIPKPDATYASMAMDWGALSIVAPYIETTDQIKELIGAVKYKPLKGDLLKSGLDENQWNREIKEYLDQKNNQRSLIINIESTPALDDLDSLLSIPGLDGVLIGPHDLSVSLGIPEQYEHPLFYQSIEKIVTCARSHGLGAGIHTRWQLDNTKWLELDLNLVVHAEDYEAAKFKFSDDFHILKKHKNT
ncbi:MAG: aldolase/citrate lyase family protein [candidate division KSB1 bacterium]|nr:aldolase/citrate lyase family protein [candidate division KSB1 bacterium]